MVSKFIFIFKADKVRKLKSSGVEKSIWQPEVAILLDLKKKLEMVQQKSSKGTSQVPALQQNGVIDLEKAKQLEEEVSKQV